MKILLAMMIAMLPMMAYGQDMDPVELQLELVGLQVTQTDQLRLFARSSPTAPSIGWIVAPGPFPQTDCDPKTVSVQVTGTDIKRVSLTVRSSATNIINRSHDVDGEPYSFEWDPNCADDDLKSYRLKVVAYDGAGGVGVLVGYVGTY